MKIAHPLDLDEIIKGVFPDLIGRLDAALCQGISEPTFAVADAVDHLDDGLIVTKSEVDAVELFAVEDTQFIELHGPGDDASDLQVVHAILICQVVSDQEGLGPRSIGFTAERAL